MTAGAVLLDPGRAPEAAAPPAGAACVAWAGDAARTGREAAAIVELFAAALRVPLSLVLELEPRAGVPWVGDGAAIAGGAVRTSELVLFTSGTTGTPKPVRRPLAARPKAGPAGPGERWLLTYAPGRWAGLSVMLHCLAVGAPLVVPASFAPPDLLAAAHAHGVTHVSLTPSLFRRLALALPRRDLAALALRHVTFGGEAASQKVIDDARALWPDARIAHLYAATEFGDICCVSDGLAGVPAARFRPPRFAFAADGELFIDGRATADLWVPCGDRYHFAGRRSDIITVGGANVSLLAVEQAALAVAGVGEARACGVASALLGHLVALEYSGSIEPHALGASLRQSLPKVAWPARLERVAAVTLTAAHKIDRRHDADRREDSR